MPRPLIVKLLTACICGIAVIFWLGVVVILRETGTQKVLADADAAKTVLTLRITALVIWFLGLIEAVMAIGVWRGSNFAWWISVVIHCFLALLFTYEIFDASSLDAEDILLAVVPAVIVGMHLLPQVRSWLDQHRVLTVPSNP